MGSTYINIRFPFKESKDGFFIELNSQDKEAIKSDLLHLLLTRKGQRLYLPEFGTSLLEFIFEPEDSVSFNKIRDEITTQVKKYLPKLQVNNISVTESEVSEYAAVVRLDYTITDDVFNITDFVVINI